MLCQVLARMRRTMIVAPTAGTSQVASQLSLAVSEDLYTNQQGGCLCRVCHGAVCVDMGSVMRQYVVSCKTTHDYTTLLI